VRGNLSKVLYGVLFVLFFFFGPLSLYGGLAWKLRLFVNDWRALSQRILLKVLFRPHADLRHCQLLRGFSTGGKRGNY